MNPIDADRFAVWGAARSGIAVANLLAELGKDVVLSDSADLDAIESRLSNLDPRVELETGGNVVKGADIVVVSPGLKPSLPIFDGLSVPVVSEVEIARRVSPHRWVAITGTDGKTTTTELTTHLIRGAGIEAVSAGNIGTPLSEVVLDLEEDTVVVAEVSAFQLWSTRYLPATAVTVTNLAGDHLDYFEGDFSAYRAAKQRLLELASPDAVAVLRSEQEPMSTWAKEYAGAVRTFSATPGAWDGDLCFEDGWIHSDHIPVVDWAAVPLIGAHNALNVMTAYALAESVGASCETFEDSLKAFEPLPHRVEPLGEVDGVRFINDSKATNVHAALTGLRAVEGELVVIAGGVDKGLELGEFASYLTERGAEVVLIGQIRRRLADALRKAGLAETSLTLASTFEEAVENAHRRAKPGKTVVLSPACSSFDMFSSYVDRGQKFGALVDQLRG